LGKILSIKYKNKIMYVPFEDLPEDSRIWIYQSNRKFSDAEFSEIETALQSFLEDGLLMVLV
jgi:hypothetical protein